MFWYRKNNPAALFMDCREVEKGAFANNWNPNWCVKPDVIADFRDMPFPDDTFRLVVYDPPHLTSGSMKSVINKKYGLLNKDTWRQDIADGFNECWRVLAPHGVLIFKWNDANIKATECDLKAQHKNQVALFFEQVDTAQLRNQGASNVTATKR